MNKVRLKVYKSNLSKKKPHVGPSPTGNVAATRQTSQPRFDNSKKTYLLTCWVPKTMTT